MEFSVSESTQTIDFLDTVVYKGTRFHSTGIFDLRVHQKITNRYLYIPSNSFHSISTQRGWIRGELIRYIRGHSSLSEYIQLKRKFFQRLCDRGHNSQFLMKVMNSIHYAERTKLLESTKEKKSETDFVTCTTSTQNEQQVLPFIPLHHPATSHPQLKRALLKYWHMIENDDVLAPLFTSTPTIGYRRTKNLGEWVTRSRYG